MTDAYVLDLRMREHGGPVLPAKVLLPSGRVPPGGDQVLGGYSDLVLAIHGYNVGRSEGQRKLLSFLGFMRRSVQSSSCVAAVLWPGDANLPGVLRALSYPTEERQADDTARRVVECLETNVGREAVVHIVAHSLGSRVALEACRRLAGRATGVRFQIGAVGVMAAAVVADSLARRDLYNPGVGVADRVGVLSSTADTTLRYAFGVGHLAGGLFGGGSTGTQRPALGLVGPRPSVDGVVHRPVGSSGVNHSDYLPSGPALPGSTSSAQRAAGWARELLDGIPSPRF